MNLLRVINLATYARKKYCKAYTSNNIGVQSFVHRIKGFVSRGSMSCKLSKRKRLRKISLK